MATVILLCVWIAARSVESGSVLVQVVHADGMTPMKDALVSLHRQRGGPVIREAQVGADGLALFDALEPAPDYEVEVAKPEYSTIRNWDIEVCAWRVTRMPIALRREDTPRERLRPWRR
jgi:hypothetical protein